LYGCLFLIAFLNQKGEGMKNKCRILLLVLICMGMAGSGVYAGDSCFSLRLSGQAVPRLSGDAGDGDNVPSYDDAFDVGLGLNVEGAWQLSRGVSLLVGIGCESQSGKTYKGISFDDREIIPVYIGGKYQLTGVKSPWTPYLRADVGMAHLDAVDISYLGTSTQYWGSSWEPMLDVGAGVEYRNGSLGFFMEIKARFMDSPESSLRPFSDADAAWSLPLTVGVSFYL
jgi:hypothetical protein